MGFTSLVEHRIALKPNAVSNHQRPYRLPPDKREVLRHQLDELLKQGIISPVEENEDVPITSPIVLVAKRNKPKVNPEHITREDSLSSYRFCVDFRYLNSQTQDFRYTIPDLQELTESLSDHAPRYMSFLDMSSGYFFKLAYLLTQPSTVLLTHVLEHTNFYGYLWVCDKAQMFSSCSWIKFYMV